MDPKELDQLHVNLVDFASQLQTVLGMTEKLISNLEELSFQEKFQPEDDKPINSNS